LLVATHVVLFRITRILRHRAIRPAASATTRGAFHIRGAHRRLAGDGR
jgi:hypothetical protein